MDQIHTLSPPDAILHQAHFPLWIRWFIQCFAMHQLVQDYAGRICAVSVGIAPGAIQEGVRKILVAEKDFDFGVGQRHRSKPVALVVRSQTLGGLRLEKHASHLGQVSIEFVMQMRRVIGSGDGSPKRRADLLFDRRTK